MSLHVIREPQEMRRHAEQLRRDGRRIGFVPTMGYLHEGHVSLMREGRKRCDTLVMSIFVNPTQFAPTEDLARYPRDLEGDLEKARGAGVDLAFVPEAASMYPPGFQTFVEVRELQKPLCGVSRPIHFAGVATVVTKLFLLVQPHVALFGEKDFQQLAVIRRMVRDLDLGVQIVGMPIVREADGLAMSSRNAYLSAEERREALALSRSLARAEEIVKSGERDAKTIVAAARAVIEAAKGIRIDYVELRDAESLEEIARLERPAVLALAAFLGKTRLIDNRVLS
jgi:pantoate--beta-alanine ligase